MKTSPTLFGTVKCVFPLVVLLLATAAGSNTAAFQPAAAQAEATLPAPTGPHQTGRMSFH